MDPLSKTTTWSRWRFCAFALLSAACTTDLFEVTADVDTPEGGRDGGGDSGAGVGMDGAPPDGMEAGGPPGDAATNDGGPGPDGFGLVESVPSDDAEGIDPFTDLKLTFNQDVAAGNGSITVIDDDREQVFDVVAASSGRVSIDGGSVTIDVRGMFTPGAKYHVEVDEGAIVSDAGESFRGWDDRRTLNFTAAELAGPGGVSDDLMLWLDAQEPRSFELASESLVRLWIDRSGKGNDVSQQDSAARPSLDAAGLSARPAVSFDGEDDLLRTNDPLELEAFDGFVVWLPNEDASTSSKTCVLKHGDNVELNHGHDVSRRRNAVGSKFGDGESGWYTSSFTGTREGTPQLRNFALNASTNTLEARTMGGGPMAMQGESDAPLPPGTTPVQSDTPFTLGNSNDGGAALRGAIAEVILFSRDLTLIERIAVTAYLRNRWGVDHEPCSAGLEDGVVTPNDTCAYARKSTTSWAVGRGRCREFGDGWDLFAPRTERDNAFATGLLLRDARGRGWLGGSDNVEEGNWTWAKDGQTFWLGASAEEGGAAPEDAYSNWASGEPSADADADCSIIYGTQGDRDGLWADERCASAAVAICEGPLE
jgi:hypothetical protein